MPHATDRAGNELPSTPTTADLEQLADRLRVVPEDELARSVVDRFSPDELEERRRRAIGQ
jgi:hypothetical protein